MIITHYLKCAYSICTDVSSFTASCSRDISTFGQYNGRLIQLYLYFSRLHWERGYHDDAFNSLDLALEHAKELAAIYNNGSEHSFTAPLVSFVKYTPDSAHATESPARIAKLLPEDWPFWCNPDCSHVEKEIKADPR